MKLHRGIVLCHPDMRAVCRDRKFPFHLRLQFAIPKITLNEDDEFGEDFPGDEKQIARQHEYSANFLFTLWKRVRKYGAYASGITQNVDDLLQSHTARTMLANSEFIIMLNQASTDRLELAKLLNISDLQMSYITNVEAGHGLIKVGSSPQYRCQLISQRHE